MAEYHELSAELRARIAMEKHRFHTTYSLGQNFILDDKLIDHLLGMAEIKNTDCVLEIGPGAGVMTSRLAASAEKVLALEVDKNLEPVLSDVLSGMENVHVVFQDVMKADLITLIRQYFGDKPYRVVANLPYYITADIMTRLVTCDRRPESIVIMVQKEAAERMMSAPGEKQWCALAATLQFYGNIHVLDEVPPEVFFPKPHVVSNFIRIDLYENRPIQPTDEKLFLRLINAAFAMRRKTLANNLKAAFALKLEEAMAALQAAGLSPQVRGEALTLEELARLSEYLPAGK